MTLTGSVSIGRASSCGLASLCIANDRVVVPLLDPHTDEAALAIVAGAFPERGIVGVASHEILLGGSNIHCITQHVPAPGPTRVA